MLLLFPDVRAVAFLTMICRKRWTERGTVLNRDTFDATMTLWTESKQAEGTAENVLLFIHEVWIKICDSDYRM
jgi:hypothetical protein